MASHKGRLSRVALSTFAGTGVNVTSNGRPYLGAEVGSAEFIESFVESKGSPG